MLKKRVIFTLLYDRGNFVLSRNFRLQKVGDIKWLQDNYNFAKVAFYIDELVILDVSRGQRDFKLFCDVLSQISKTLFVPVSAGGGIKTFDDAKEIFRSGADKIVLNTALIENQEFVKQLSVKFGQQSIVGSMDFKRGLIDPIGYHIFYNNASQSFEFNPAQIFNAMTGVVGEWYINSIDRDGTGQGFDFEILDQIYPFIDQPIIYAGGVGNVQHLSAGLDDNRIDAVATANLFNFVDDGLKLAKLRLLEMGYQLTNWKLSDALEFINDK